MIVSNILLTSANLCFHLCCLATTQVEARLCAVEEDTFEVYLYVTIKDEKVSERIVFLKYFIVILNFTLIKQNKCQEKHCSSYSIEIVLIS